MRALLISLSLVGCSYSPDIGQSPFRCGLEMNKPRCPDGYQCVEYSAMRQICEQVNAADGGTFTDVSDFQCENDGELEPNNSLESPSVTPIPDQSSSWRLGNLAICPVDDEDYYQLGLINQGSIRADIEFQSEQGNLQVNILNMAGTAIASGSPQNDNPNRLRAEIQVAPAGTYFIQVKAAEDRPNNYSMDLLVTGQ